MFVTERPGRVRVYSGGGPTATLLGTTTLPGVRAVGESGVMGIAVDHLFLSNRLVYVCLSRMASGEFVNQVIRYRVTSAWRLVFDRWMVRYNMRASTIHNGCAVEEGPDQKIWVSMGDAANPSDAQDPSKLNGKILRMNRDGTVPADNPVWPGASGPRKVYSIGHRNPQGIAFHPMTGRVYAIEHGPDVHDEINWIRSGRNYGWPCVTGYGTPNTGCSGNFTNPVWATGFFTIAPSNGTFLKGAIWENWRNNLVTAQLKESDLRRFTVAASGSPVTYQSTHYNGTWGRLRAAVIGPNDYLWLTTSNGSNDRVIRIIPT
jgi:glucose/arabinose dehydrogenase